MPSSKSENRWPTLGFLHYVICVVSVGKEAPRLAVGHRERSSVEFEDFAVQNPPRRRPSRPPTPDHERIDWRSTRSVSRNRSAASVPAIA